MQNIEQIIQAHHYKRMMEQTQNNSPGLNPETRQINQETRIYNP